jgi:hypothetical protein
VYVTTVLVLRSRRRFIWAPTNKYFVYSVASCFNIYSTYIKGSVFHSILFSFSLFPFGSLRLSQPLHRSPPSSTQPCQCVHSLEHPIIPSIPSFSPLPTSILKPPTLRQILPQPTARPKKIISFLLRVGASPPSTRSPLPGGATVTDSGVPLSCCQP